VFAFEQPSIVKRAESCFAPSSTIHDNATRQSHFQRASVTVAHSAIRSTPISTPSPVSQVGVQSVDAVIKKVEAGAGTVVTPKTPIPAMGAYGRISDTEGNVIGLFESSQ
jgi:hypothetical protein